MRRSATALPVITAALLALAAGGFVTARAATARFTAKARLGEARAAAARWQPDAALVSLTALQAGDDGTTAPGVAGWVYTFHAKKAGKWAGFHAGAAGLERVDLPSGYTAPLPADFVDSDRVLAEVRRNGFKGSGDTLVTLLLQADPAIKTGVYWCVAGVADISLERGMRGWCVDPATGKFVARLAGQAAQTARPATKPAGGVARSVDLARCGGFSAGDAAAILGVPAAKVTASIKETGAGRGSCSFAAAGGEALVFDIAVWKSAAEAEADMERLRKGLNDDYSDIMGLGDDGLWTNTDQSFTARQGNVTVRVTQPPDKIMKIKAAKAFFERI